VLLVPIRYEVCTLRKKHYDELVRRIAFQPLVTNPYQMTHAMHGMLRNREDDLVLLLQHLGDVSGRL
jgi:hypothetical protein